MVVDQIGSPTYVADLVAVLLEIADRDTAPPLLHVANDGAASRFEQARAVFEGVGADPNGCNRCPAIDAEACGAAAVFGAVRARDAAAGLGRCGRGVTTGRGAG